MLWLPCKACILKLKYFWSLCRLTCLWCSWLRSDDASNVWNWARPNAAGQGMFTNGVCALSLFLRTYDQEFTMGVLVGWPSWQQCIVELAQWLFAWGAGEVPDCSAGLKFVKVESTQWLHHNGSRHLFNLNHIYLFSNSKKMVHVRFAVAVSTVSIKEMPFC